MLPAFARGATGEQMKRSFTILGIESSCDDTAAAVVTGTSDSAEVLSSVVYGQFELHSEFGGVVPEIAARAHAEKVDICVEEALASADITLADIDAIAVTSGPGLIGGVLSGVMCAKGLAVASSKPLLSINHLAGHALTPRLTDGVEFPYLMLLVSGGHCQFLIAHSDDRFERIGGTIDDAPGEAFDKTARLLGLAQPGGPHVERAAKFGDPKRHPLPRPLLDREGCDMSFSGLKTALLRSRDAVISEKHGLTAQDQSDLAASFQAAIRDILVEKTRRALAQYLELAPNEPVLAVAGGVAANMEIRNALTELCNSLSVSFVAPPLKLCTDNAAMIAYAGLAKFATGKTDDLGFSARPRWPLDASAPALLGSGKKGAKA